MQTRLNPVALVTGAASGIGAACARNLAIHASGGLILVDSDEAALSAAADALLTPPERVSTLALDIADAAAWKRAQDFIAAQFGRIDWVVSGVDADKKSAGSDLPRATLGVVNALAPLIRKNAQGGSVVLALAAHSIKIDALLQLMRIAAKEGAVSNVRVNAVINGAVESALWRRDPDFATLVREAGDETGALARIATQSIPLVRCNATQDVMRLVRLLLSDGAPVTGATLAVDGAPTL